MFSGCGTAEEVRLLLTLVSGSERHGMAVSVAGRDQTDRVNKENGSTCCPDNIAQKLFTIILLYVYMAQINCAVFLQKMHVVRSKFKPLISHLLEQSFWVQ